MKLAADHQQVSVTAGLSLSELAALTAGSGLSRTAPAAALGLPALRLSDGAAGIGGLDRDERDVAACAPCGSALGASWDVELAHELGGLIGEEARERSVDVVLGPMLNLHRTPLGGRNFECLSEDPLLAGVIGAAWIEGLQSRGVAATPKHLVANDAETARTRVDCRVDDRALREVYLLPFELAARAGAWAMMAAYNGLNGQPCTEHAELLRAVVRDDWGWDGLMMSDWLAARSTVRCANAGLDLEMPGPGRAFGRTLAQAVTSGVVSEGVVAEKAERLITLARRVGRAKPAPAPAGSREELLRRAAAAGFVLLENDGVLPMALREGGRLAVIGPNATDPCWQGGGSSRVNMAAAVDPLAAIAARFAGTEILHEVGCTQRLAPAPLHHCTLRAPGAGAEPALQVEYVSAEGKLSATERRETSVLVWPGPLPGLGSAPGGTIRASTWLIPQQDGPHEFSVRGSGPASLRVDGRAVAETAPGVQPANAFEALHDADTEARGVIVLRADVAVLVEAELGILRAPAQVLAVGCRPPEAVDGIERAVAVAAAADAAIVVVGTSEETESEGMDRSSSALPGRQDELIHRVAEANRATVVVVNAGTAVDMPWSDAAAAVLCTWLPGQAFGPALAAVLSGDLEPGGRLPVTIARSPADYPAYDPAPAMDGTRAYTESIFVGHRHFDAAALKPRFCFGHGLGYATFALESMDVSARRVSQGEALAVSVHVRNTGRRRGKEVVQLYVSQLATPVAHPPSELKAFASVTLDPGERRSVRLVLDARALSRWDPEAGAWMADAGEFELRAGRSSRDSGLVARIVVEER